MIAVYRCSLCGERYEEGRTSSVLAETFLNLLIARGEAHASLDGYGGRIYRQTVHKCANGGIGVGDIIGFEPEGRTDAEKKGMSQVRE